MSSLPSPSSLYSGPILDAHVHFWHPTETPRQASPLVKLLGWTGPKCMTWIARHVAFPKDAVLFYASAKYILSPYQPENYQQDAAEQTIKGVVHVPAAWVGNPVDETKWLESFDSSSSTKILGIVAEADLTMDGPALDALLESHKQASNRVVGIRDLIGWHPEKLVHNLTPTNQAERSRNPAFREGLARLSKHSLTFETACYYTQLNDLSELAEAYPEQKLLLDHMGIPMAVGGPYAGIMGETLEEREQILQEWQQGMRRLAKSPNTYVKLSGWSMPAFGFGYEQRNEPPTVEEIVEQVGPLVTFVIETFGPARCMFGSNFPIDKVSLPMNVLIDAFKHMVQHLSPEDQERVFCGTARTFYGIVEE